MIHNLHLRNFKKHSDLDIEFTDGLNGIFGPNYTGKTTILYGILYALGGASHVPGTNIQKLGTNTGLAVTMQFDVAGQVYEVDRKKSGASISRYDPEEDRYTLLATGTSNVTTKIEELLGMSVKRFRQLKYAEQKKAHALLTLGVTELHKIIEELTGIDEINKAMSKLRDIVSSSAGAMEALHFEDPQEEEDNQVKLVGEIEALDTKVLETKERLRGESETQGKLKRINAGLCSLKQEWDSWNTKRGSLASALEVYKTQVASLNEEYNPLDYEDACVWERNEIEIPKKSQYLSQCREYKGNMSALVKEHTRMSDQISKTRKIISQCSKDLEEFDSDLEFQADKARVRMGKMADKLTDLQSEFSNKTKLNKDSKCPVCLREYEGKSQVSPKDLADLESKVNSTNLAYREDRERSRELARMVQLKEQADEDLHRNTAALQEMLVNLDENESEQKSLSAEIPDNLDELTAELEKLRQQQAKYRAHTSRMESVRQDLEKAEYCLSNCQQDLDKLSEPEFDAEALETNRKVLDSCNKTHEALSNELITAEHTLGMRETGLDHCRENLARMMGNNKAYDVAKKRHGTAKTLQKYLRDNRDRYSRETWDFFLGSASTFVSDCTGGVISEIQRTDLGQFQFVEEERVMGMKDASGAQEAIMGLSVQMALAQAAQCPLDILLVDEPTADMDDEHSMAVAAMLSTKGNQVIAISHRDMDASLCNNVINMENTQ